MNAEEKSYTQCAKITNAINVFYILTLKNHSVHFHQEPVLYNKETQTQNAEPEEPPGELEILRV